MPDATIDYPQIWPPMHMRDAYFVERALHSATQIQNTTSNTVSTS